MPILNANGLHPLYSYQLLAYCAINYRLVRAILTHQTLEGFYAAVIYDDAAGLQGSSEFCHLLQA